LLKAEKPRGLPIAVIACEVSGMDTVSDPVITGTDDQSRLVRALTNPALYGPGCTAVRVVETHISYVLLTGRHAYKIKKLSIWASWISRVWPPAISIAIENWS
jgi:hypothetical protein